MSSSRIGIRICGDWAATTGLANAARRLASALLRTGVDLTVAEFHSGAPREPWLFPEALRQLQDGPPRSISLWTLNINELHQISDDELRLASALNIATWFWELPTIPMWIQPQIARVSEIWAPTRFVHRALIRHTDVPVKVLPPVVPVFRADAAPSVLRDRLGISVGRRVFLASFDFNSGVSRKNPLGAVSAFSRAFGRSGHDGPLLIIKAINVPPGDFGALLVREVDEVKGLLINHNMTHQEFANLFHACDIYVSLHRSEGFGLGLAEAMALGKPVIGTAYSGNLDFMSVDNSCLVGYELREIEPSDHAQNPGIEATYEGGALWAEPDLDEAAEWMSLLAADPEQGTRIGASAMHSISAGFSEAAVGATALSYLRDAYSRL